MFNLGGLVIGTSFSPETNIPEGWHCNATYQTMNRGK